SKDEVINNEGKHVTMEQSRKMFMEKIEGIKNIEDILVVKDVGPEDEEVVDDVETNKETEEEPPNPSIENWLAAIKLWLKSAAKKEIGSILTMPLL
ncbi:hypothetical protein J6590_098976, partial [Homalodisca vitripennis]